MSRPFSRFDSAPFYRDARKHKEQELIIVRSRGETKSWFVINELRLGRMWFLGAAMRRNFDSEFRGPVCFPSLEPQLFEPTRVREEDKDPSKIIFNAIVTRFVHL